MKDFTAYLQEQLQNHPSMQPQDVVKLCYQAAFGAEHLLQDLDRARAYLQREFEEVTPQDLPLYEAVSPTVCRVNLAAWKYHRLPLKWLFEIFTASAGEMSAGEAVFRAYLKEAEESLPQAAFSPEDWKDYLMQYHQTGPVPVHHSAVYREKEKPAYRIINSAWLRFLPLLKKTAAVLEQKAVCIIAIDGRAASGKTTAASLLQQILCADVIRMDDFFLPTELRTEARFAEPGGNIHYERFNEEVVPFLSSAEDFSYRIFDCSQMDFNGRRTMGNGKIRIVEGSYSCHPLLGKYADIRVFLDVDAEEQMHRIQIRNGEQMADMFRRRWIPLEEAYFEAYQIAEQADLRL